MLGSPDVAWTEYQPWNSGLTNLAVAKDRGAHWTAIALSPAVDRNHWLLLPVVLQMGCA